jgi:hypothetical protein
MTTPDSSPDAGQPMTESTVLFSGHRLVPLSYAEGRFGCQVVAPRGETLQLLRDFATPGEALVQGQLWLMQHLNRDLSRSALQAPRLQRPRRER